MPPFTRFHAACATLLLSAGCYGPMYSQPYGYPTYPGQPAGTPYYPGGTVAPGGTILGPGSGTPTFDGSGAGSSGGNAPLYNSGSGAGGTDTSNRPVPNYDDPRSGGPYYTNPNSTSGQPGSTARDRLGNVPGDLEPHPAAGGNTGSSPTGGFDAGNPGDAFEKPIDTNANPISLSREVTSAATPRYGYDSTGHAWLQGVVSFDPQDRTWGIVYSVNPDAQDPFAGYLTLAHDPRLSTLHDGDVVRLDGQVDPVARDHFGRATYLVSRITPVRG
jgi:hypothetical protein